MWLKMTREELGDETGAVSGGQILRVLSLLMRTLNLNLNKTKSHLGFK